MKRFPLPRIFVLLLAASTLMASAITCARAEVIRSFDTTIKLQKDTSLDVNEVIVMDFESAQRHGIFRNMPVVYNRNGGQYSLYVKILSLTDENGNSWQYKTSREGRDLNIKIGDPDQTFSGVHTYRIHYLVRRAVNFFKGAPEVYWNATGDQWPFEMQRVTARFIPPPGVSTPQIKTASFVGPPGSTTPGSIEVQADSVLFFTSNLPPGDGLTLVAGLPQGSVVPPSALQNLLWFLADWWPALFLPLFSLGLLTMLYLKGGRDVDGNQAVAVEWNPPTDLSPAEVGTLVDEKCDMADVVSTLVDLAARGYLTIEQTQTEKLLFLSSKDYIFHKVEPSPPLSTLLPHERAFYDGVFGLGSHVALSSLKNNFYTHLPGIRNGIFESLMSKNLFTSNPESTRGTYAGAGIALIVIGVVLIFVLGAFGKAAWGIGLAGAGLFSLLFSGAMPSKTATGSKMLRQCLGFQRFVALAEKDRIKVLAAEDPTVFGRLLPYAMVLGVADQWADAFKDLLTEPPNWYTGPGYGHGVFMPALFVNDLGQGMNSMGNTFSSQPQSTSGSGGSGFSGGGSGGGFGGGGGGSW